MAIEIERKFLLKNDNWRNQVISSTLFKQGYLSGSDKASVRVRIEGEKANINIKSMTLCITRQEYEYTIPLSDAETMLDSLCEKPLVEKTRHIVMYKEHKWEIDEFSGDNEGLFVAEIELNDETEAFAIPDWLGEDVSDQPEYYNVNLVKHPFKNW